MNTGLNPGISFADITTIGVGGAIGEFLEPKNAEELIAAVSQADRDRLPLCIIGGGSNLLMGDQPFPGIVVRYAARGIEVLDPSSSRTNTSGSTNDPAGRNGAHRRVQLRVQAGCNWDDFVARSIDLGLAGVEGLSGIPGTVGASVVQNIGAYGQEVSSSVESVQAWDRQLLRVVTLRPEQLEFGYRTSALKRSMVAADGTRDARYYPSPRFVVLVVTFTLSATRIDTVEFSQLARALGVELGAVVHTDAIRASVLAVRASKGMLEDAHRYERAAMRGTKDAKLLSVALQHQDALEQQDCHGETFRSDRHSCGSFFINPIATAERAAELPDDAPKFAAVLPNGTPGVKTSAAWLIDHAGFHRGFALEPQSKAGVSTRHTLALVNRGGAASRDVTDLARGIQRGVFERFGVQLVPEPVTYGVDL